VKNNTRDFFFFLRFFFQGVSVSFRWKLAINESGAGAPKSRNRNRNRRNRAKAAHGDNDASIPGTAAYVAASKTTTGAGAARPGPSAAAAAAGQPASTASSNNHRTNAPNPSRNNAARAAQPKGPALATLTAEFAPSGLCDIGINLCHRTYGSHWREVAARGREAGVTALVVTGTSVRATRAAATLCETHARSPEAARVQIKFTAGVHPHDSKHYVVGRTCDELRAIIDQAGGCVLRFFGFFF
jgi:hypothetical protein